MTGGDKMTNKKYGKSDIIELLKWCIKEDYIQETLKYFQHGKKSDKLKELEKIFGRK